MNIIMIVNVIILGIEVSRILVSNIRNIIMIVVIVILVIVVSRFLGSMSRNNRRLLGSATIGVPVVIET